MRYRSAKNDLLLDDGSLLQVETQTRSWLGYATSTGRTCWCRLAYHTMTHTWYVCVFLP